jgi:NADH dehydrogenase
VFVVGDLAGAADGKGGLLPQVAQPAIQEARHAAQNIELTLKGEPRTGFVYKDKGIMATIGRNAAVTELPERGQVQGRARLVHVAGAAPGLHHRVPQPVAVLVNWIWSYLTYDRHARIIVAVEPARRAGAAPPTAAPSPAGSGERPVLS